MSPRVPPTPQPAHLWSPPFHSPASEANHPISLTEQLVHSTVRLMARTAPDGEWDQVGTGFYWNTVLTGGTEFSAIITSRHILADASELRVQLHLRDADNRPVAGPGEAFVIKGERLRIVLHPDPSVDLGLIAFGPAVHSFSPAPFFRSIFETDLPDEATIQAMPAVQEILMIGYPTGLADSRNNYPIVRRGTTAIPPWIDYEGRQDLLCDIAVYPGSSGSPVFVVHERSRVLRDGSVQTGVRKIWLLGVLYAGPSLSDPEAASLSGAEPICRPIHLGLCVKAVRVRELVDHALLTFGLNRRAPVVAPWTGARMPTP